MEGGIHISNRKEVEEEFSIKKFFVPLTTVKAVHIIFIVGILVFANMLFSPFVWDDNDYILNAAVVHTFSIPSFFSSNVFNNAGQYRPLSVFYFASLYTIFGGNQFFYHGIQLLLHITNAVLLFFLFKAFLSKRLSLFLSLVFLVHPLQVESVSYISASDSPLFFLFGISALLLGISQKRTDKKSGFQFVLLFISLLIKETGILFFPLILFYQYLFKKRNVLFSLLFCSITIAVYYIVRSIIGNVSLANRPMIPIARLSFTDRLFTMPQVLFYYLKTFFFPATLAINQQWVVTKITISNFYLPLFSDIFFFGLLSVLGYVLYKRTVAFKIYCFFSVWFLLGLGLHSQIVPLDATVADRWAYFALAGLLGMIGILLQNLLPTVLKKNNTLFISVAVVVILLFSLRTILQNSVWQNPVKLWHQAISVDDNYLSEEELSTVLLMNGQVQQALFPAKKSVAQFPSDLNLYNLGYIYELSGKYHLAQKAYLGAYHAKNYIPWQHKHYLAVYVRTGNVLLYFKKWKQAKLVLANGLNDYPDTPELLIRLSISDYELGDHKKALALAKQAHQLAPENSSVSIIYQKISNNLRITIQL
jgi:protein O-mannosyl-transferase